MDTLQVARSSGLLNGQNSSSGPSQGYKSSSSTGNEFPHSQAETASVRPSDQVSMGSILLSHPMLTERAFARSAILVLDHTDKGCLGE
eukprot:scaffold38566_cov35-Prasinocladus_malaysianus.AAC.1